MEETPQRVLVVVPHPDDAEIWCGGTLARWIGQGAEVVYVVCTDGGKGTDKPGITAAELAAPGTGSRWLPPKCWGSRK